MTPDLAKILIGTFIMAGTTYIIRALPFVIFRRKITNRFVKSFLFYVPYAVLSAMTFPAIFYATGSALSAAAGTVVALVLAFFGRSLVTVAIAAAAAAALVAVLL